MQLLVKRAIVLVHSDWEQQPERVPLRNIHWPVLNFDSSVNLLTCASSHAQAQISMCVSLCNSVLAPLVGLDALAQSSK